MSPGEWAPESGHEPGESAEQEIAHILGPPNLDGPSPVNDLAAAVRRLTDLMVGRTLPDDELGAAARLIDDLVDRLAVQAAPGKAARRLPNRDGPPQDYFVTSPVIGFANPIAPPVRVWAVQNDHGELEMRGRAFLGYAYEGPPTCVHGGIIAEVFDELLGSTNILVGRAGMTGTLTVRYRKPTPLMTDLDLEARLLGVDGRKIRVWGGILLDGEITAEAEGLFIEAGPSRMLEIVAKNAKSAGDGVVDPQIAEALQIARSRSSR